MIDLKPCPFCGGSAELDADGPSGGNFPDPDFRVRCSNGDCPMPPCEYAFTEEQAIAAWNTRTITLTDEEQKELVEVMAKAIALTKVSTPTEKAQAALTSALEYLRGRNT